MSTAVPDNRNRMVLLLIAGIPVTIVLAATWLWYFVAQGELDLVAALGTANQGELVQPPRQVADYPLRSAGNIDFVYDELQPRWTFVVPVSSPCDAVCEATLFTTRQIHIAMGKGYNRIRRIAVSQQPAAAVPVTAAALSDGRPALADLGALLQQEHPDINALTLAPEQFDALFEGRSVPQGTWFVVDPGGWLMMAYDKDIHFRDVISDLKFLLKNSSG